MGHEGERREGGLLVAEGERESESIMEEERDVEVKGGGGWEIG